MTWCHLEAERAAQDLERFFGAEGIIQACPRILDRTRGAAMSIHQDGNAHFSRQYPKFRSVRYGRSVR